MLVDDTPLAFLAQPDNGIPIFNFRGDVDDRVLVEVRPPHLRWHCMSMRRLLLDGHCFWL